jgi:hypothetical protein
MGLIFWASQALCLRVEKLSRKFNKLRNVAFFEEKGTVSFRIPSARKEEDGHRMMFNLVQKVWAQNPQEIHSFKRRNCTLWT